MRGFSIVLGAAAVLCVFSFAGAQADDVPIPCYRVTFKITAYPGAILRNVIADAVTGNAKARQELIDEKGKPGKDYLDVCVKNETPGNPTTIQVFADHPSDVLFDFLVTTTYSSNAEYRLTLKRPQ